MHQYLNQTREGAHPALERLWAACMVFYVCVFVFATAVVAAAFWALTRIYIYALFSCAVHCTRLVLDVPQTRARWALSSLSPTSHIFHGHHKATTNKSEANCAARREAQIVCDVDLKQSIEATEAKRARRRCVYKFVQKTKDTTHTHKRHMWIEYEIGWLGCIRCSARVHTKPHRVACHTKANTQTHTTTKHICLLFSFLLRVGFAAALWIICIYSVYSASWLAPRRLVNCYWGTAKINCIARRREWHIRRWIYAFVKRVSVCVCVCVCEAAAHKSDARGGTSGCDEYRPRSV